MRYYESFVVQTTIPQTFGGWLRANASAWGDRWGLKTTLFRGSVLFWGNKWGNNSHKPL